MVVVTEEVGETGAGAERGWTTEIETEADFERFSGSFCVFVVITS